MVVVVVTVAPPWLRCFRVPNAIAIRCLQGLEEWLSELSNTLGIDFGSGCRVHYTRVARGPFTFITVPTLVCSHRDIADDTDVIRVLAGAKLPVQGRPPVRLKTTLSR